MKVVFLHGIGDGDPDGEWLAGLNRGLEQAGHAALHDDQIIAPRYSSFLKTDGISAKLPPITYRTRDDAASRRDFERRQARVQRILRITQRVRAFGFDWIPDPLWDALPPFVISTTNFLDLDQVRRYVRQEGVRGAVMSHILDHLPSYGDVILIGHSLGSVIAIDLLDHLPERLHVRRFITIGSPANIKALHDGSERLLKKFPYSRVDDWSNFLNRADIVTGGRGLAAVFPGAQDFVLNVSGHDAGTYLGDSAVAGLVAEMLYPSKAVVPATSDVVVRMTDAETSALLVQHFAEAVANSIKDADRAERYRSALKLLREDLAAQLTQQAATGRPLAPEIHELASGRLPELPHRWELHEAVGELVVLALTNCVTPYEIEVGEAPMLALQDIAVQIGHRRDLGKKVETAIKDVQRCVSGRAGVPWGRVLTAAAGVALVAAGPIGLAVAAPATAFGAAAITGSLAAFGPGGMVGGLALLSGLVGSGAAVTAAAVTGESDTGNGAPNLAKLMLQVATEHARKLLDLPHDSTLWYHLTDFESQISAALNRLTAFSDPKSPKVTQLQEAKIAIQALLRFMIERDLGPSAITDGEKK
jgi:pimeloyl-ACP methyl ester carboxylesterase